MDIYLASGSSTSVKIQSGTDGTNTTTLTLDNDAKISGLTGASSAVTHEDVTAIVEGDAEGNITNITATTGTSSTGSPAPDNYLGIKSGESSGTIAAAADSGAKNYEILIASIASVDGT